MRIALAGLVAGLVACTGPQGPAGPPGSPVIGTVTKCRALHAGSWVEYEIAVYDTGDVFVSCAVLGQSHTSSNLNFYRAGDPLADSAECEVAHDADSAPSGGRYSFSSLYGKRTVTYDDAGSMFDKQTIDLTSVCVTN